MTNKFYILAIEYSESELNHQTLFDGLVKHLAANTEIDIAKDNRIQLSIRDHVRHNIDLYDAFPHVALTASDKPGTFIVEIDNMNRIVAIYDAYFSQTVSNEHYKVNMNDLFIDAGKYRDQALNKERLNASIAYGLMKELSQHNASNSHSYKRGLALIDFLYKNRPKETYKIIKPTKKINSYHFLKRFFNDDICRKISDEVNAIPGLPQVNINEFDSEALKDALKVGTFELTGPAIDRLKAFAQKCISKCSEILNLPLEVLSTVPNAGFNGFQNVREETLQRFKLNGSGVIRNQIAFHFKPYKSPYAPQGVNMDAYYEYYAEGIAILHTLFRKIAVAYNIDEKDFIDYLNDQLSVLTTRKYSPCNVGETGIPSHSDYGLLTLVVSDVAGLEVEKDSKWVPAPVGPDLRFFINFGDWFGFILKNKGIQCKLGIHRVPDVATIRHSLALFLNPSPSHEVKVPNGEVIPYETYLKSPKVPYVIPKN